MKIIWKLNTGLLALMCIWSALYVTDLNTQYSIEQFYPARHSLIKNHQEIIDEFRLHEDSPYLFVIEMPKQSWHKKEFVNKLKFLSDSIQDREDVKSVISLTHIEGASQSKDEMIIGNIFDRSPASDWKTEVLNNSLLYPLLITKDFKSTLLAVESVPKDNMALEQFESELRTEIQNSFPQAKIHSAGVPLLQMKLSNKIQEELVSFLIYISLAFCLVFYLLFSHWTVILSVFLILCASNVFAIALMARFGISMNVILVTLPVILSVSMMSLLIHTLHLWGNKRSTGDNFEQRLSKSYLVLKDIFLPNLLGVLTTAFGFLALAPSQIPLISQYGWTVFLILLFVAVVGQMMLFLIMPFVRPQMRAWVSQPARWALWSLNHSKLIIILMVLTGTSSIFLISRLNFSLRLFDDLPKSDETRQTSEWIDKSFGGILSFEIKALAKPGFWKTTTALKELQLLTTDLRKSGKLGTVVTISDFFQGQIPDNESQLSETLFMFSMAEKDPLKSFLTEDGSSLRIAVKLNDIPSHEIEQKKEAILATCREYFPDISFSTGGMASYAHSINQEVAKELLFSFWEPLLFIGVFLVFIFRSLKWALLACLPNFIPPAILIGALALTQVPVKPGIALIFSISLGFAFNNTLYILTRLKKNPSLKRALLREANPCLFESLIMFTGFTIFLTSQFNMNQIFGGFMLLSILAGLAADLFFLPAFLKEFPQVYKKRSTAKLVATTAALALISLPVIAMPLPDAKEILKKSQALLDAKDDKATVEMKIIEDNGEMKSRILNLQTLRKDGFSVLARIQSPADIKNMAFLGNVDEEGNEKQWIYLPSSGKVRRLVTGKSKAGLLGSEISPEDLNSEAIKSSSVKMQKVDEKYYWIELIPEAGTSDYSKVITKISKDDFLPKFTAYYVKERLKKTVAFKDYKKIGKIFRAQAFSVQNHINGRSTEVKLTGIQVNTGLSEDDFTQSNLKD